MSRSGYAALYLYLLSSITPVLAAEWEQRRSLDERQPLPIGTIFQSAADGDGGFWIVGSVDRLSDGELLLAVRRVRSESAPIGGPRRAVNGLLPLDDEHLLLYPAPRGLASGQSLLIIDDQGALVSGASLPATCSPPLRNDADSIWIACGNEMRRLDLRGQPLDTRRFDLDWRVSAVDLQPLADGMLLSTHNVPMGESCFISLDADAQPQWRSCVPNHRPPETVIASDYIYVELGRGDARVLLTTLSATDGRLLRSEYFHPASQSFGRATRPSYALGNELLTARVIPQSNLVELAAYRPDRGWRSVFTAESDGELQAFLVTEDQSLVLVSKAADALNVVSVDANGTENWTVVRPEQESPTLDLLGDGAFVYTALFADRSDRTAYRFDRNGNQIGAAIDTIEGYRSNGEGVFDPLHGRFWAAEYDAASPRLRLRGTGFGPDPDRIVDFQGALQLRGRPNSLTYTGSRVCRLAVDLHCVPTDGSQPFSTSLQDFPIGDYRSVALDESSDGELRLAVTHFNTAAFAALDQHGALSYFGSTHYPATVFQHSRYDADSGMLLRLQAGLGILVTNTLVQVNRFGEPIDNPALAGSNSGAIGLAGGDVLIFERMLTRVAADGSVRWQTSLAQDRDIQALNVLGLGAGLLMLVDFNPTDGIPKLIGVDLETGQVRWQVAFGRDSPTLNPQLSHFMLDQDGTQVLWELQNRGPSIEIVRTRMNDGTVDRRLLLPCARWYCSILTSAVSTSGELLVSSRDARSPSAAAMLSRIDLHRLGDAPSIQAAGVLSLRQVGTPDQGVVVSQANGVVRTGYWHGFVRDTDGVRRAQWWRMAATPADPVSGALTLDIYAPRYPALPVSAEAIVSAAALERMSDGEWLLRQSQPGPERAPLFSSAQSKRMQPEPEIVSPGKLWVPASGHSGWLYLSVDRGVWGLSSGRWLRLQRQASGRWSLLLEQGGEHDDQPRVGEDRPKRSIPVGSALIVGGGCFNSVWQFQLDRPQDFPELRALQRAMPLTADESCR